MVMTGVERREEKRSNARLLLIGQRESEWIISGLTGSLVAHVAKSADCDAYAFVVLIDAGKERRMLFVVWDESVLKRAYSTACTTSGL